MTQPRPADALDAEDKAFAVLAVAQIQTEDSLLIILDEGKIIDEAGLGQHARNLALEFGGRDINSPMPGVAGIADTGQHIGDWIGHTHDFFSSPLGSYQLALVTPGISPLRASSRKQMRHRPNFR